MDRFIYSFIGFNEFYFAPVVPGYKKKMSKSKWPQVVPGPGEVGVTVP